MKKQKFKFPVKSVTLSAIIFLALCFILGYIWMILCSSAYFEVSDILIKEANTVDLGYLKGKNIFALNLTKESRYIRSFFPNCSNVRLVKVLPNRLYVDFVNRQPAAMVRLYKFFLVDESGVLFLPAAQPQEMELPLITGLETRIFGPKAGVQYNNKELLLALKILKEAKKNRILQRFKISRINIGSASDLSIFIPLPLKLPENQRAAALKSLQDLEVKMSQDNSGDKISMLGGVLFAANKDLGNIKYIDLRFKEPVVKLKDAKTSR